MATLTHCADEWLVRLLTGKGLLDEVAGERLIQGARPYASLELIRRRMVSKADLAAAVRAQYDIGFAEPGRETLDKMALSLVPEHLCRRRMLVPIRLDGPVIELLMANPLDQEALGEISAVSGRRAIPVFGLPERVEELIAAGYGSDSAIYDLLKKLPDDVYVETIAPVEEAAPAGVLPGTLGMPVLRLANMLIAQAVRLKASDIHIEHDDKVTLVRYRIDGDLRSMMRIPKSIGEGPLVSRIKIMANLDVADRRRPQDGRAKLLVGVEEIGLRVSTMPTSFGEKVVLRILDQRSAEMSLEDLGFRPKILQRLLALSASNQGMMLITGPTGSGKTTTLYSLLNRNKTEEINVTTIEDPIEYRLAGINQIQINDKAGLTFAAVLRSVLRQDPDTILVGEIRDSETADIAFQAALTGHLVFATLHTNDSVSTITRLLDMGVDRFKLAPALIGVTAQRLARRVCSECRVETTADGELARRMSAVGLLARRFKGQGCAACSFTGLKGRIALTELLDLGDPLAREFLNAAMDGPSLRLEAVKRGWLMTLADDALWHLSQGDIPLEEAAAYFDAGALPVLPAGGPAAAKRVLIVDDNADNRAVISAAIGMEGYEVAEADGGAAALESVARRRPDLILLDLMMPEIDGFAVLKKLRGELGMTDLPVMVITAMNEADSQAAALEVGADDYMTKPFSPRILRARVKAMFRRVECA